MESWFTTNESLLHRQLVLELVDRFIGRGLIVRYADAYGWPDPPAIGRHKPDLIAEDADGVWVIGEAKTGEGDLATEHSRQQYFDFANSTMPGTRRLCPFYILVPAEHETELRGILWEVGVAWSANVNVLTHGWALPSPAWKHEGRW